MNMQMPFSSLRTKLFLAFFLLSAIITLAVSYQLLMHMQTNHLNTLKHDWSIIAELAMEQDDGRNLAALLKRDVPYDEAVEIAMHSFQTRLREKDVDLAAIYVWNQRQKKGWMYSSLQEPLLDKDAFARMQELTEETGAADASGASATTEISDDFTSFIYVPVKEAPNSAVATIVLIVSNKEAAADIQHFTYQVGQGYFLALVLVGSISWWLAKNFSKRLLLLQSAMKQMTEGNLDITLAESGRDELALLTQSLNHLAMKLSHEREELLLSAIESLVTALEAKDTYTYGHSSHVSAMASAMAQKMEFNEEELFGVRVAALLHDIGKIGIPDQVLHKAGRLTQEERSVIEQHPSIGAKILTGIPALHTVANVVRHHHERWDGQGYPAAIAGKNIPLASRIIAVADTYQAMTSDRPYRKGLAHQAALAELKRNAGSQFDPKLVDVFLSLHLERKDS